MRGIPATPTDATGAAGSRVAWELVAFAIGCLVIVWVWSSFAFTFGIAWPLHCSALVEAGVAALGLAAAFGHAERDATRPEVTELPGDQLPSTHAT